MEGNDSELYHHAEQGDGNTTKGKGGKTGNKTSFCITKEEKEEGRLHISTSLEGLVNDTLLEDD